MNVTVNHKKRSLPIANSINLVKRRAVLDIVHLAKSNFRSKDKTFIPATTASPPSLTMDVKAHASGY
jgi:hypothetical protein